MGWSQFARMLPGESGRRDTRASPAWAEGCPEVEQAQEVLHSTDHAPYAVAVQVPGSPTEVSNGASRGFPWDGS